MRRATDEGRMHVLDDRSAPGASCHFCERGMEHAHVQLSTSFVSDVTRDVLRSRPDNARSFDLAARLDCPECGLSRLFRRTVWGGGVRQFAKRIKRAAQFAQHKHFEACRGRAAVSPSSA